MNSRISFGYPILRARSGVTDEAFAFPLDKLWVHSAPQSPSPAWPEPGRAMHRIDFDYAFQPVIKGRKCYVASDDGVAYCLDAATGKLVWEFRTAPESRQMVGNGRMISRWPCGEVFQPAQHDVRRNLTTNDRQ